MHGSKIVKLSTRAGAELHRESVTATEQTLTLH